MACGKCGGRRDTSILGAHLPSGNYVRDENGLFPLAQAPDCTEKYHGQFQGASVFVVGMGTEKEKLFVRGQKVEAMKYAKAQETSLDHVHVTSLCHEPVLGLLGA